MRRAHHVGGERVGDGPERLADVRSAGEVEDLVGAGGLDGLSHGVSVGHFEDDPAGAIPLGDDVACPGVHLDVGVGFDQPEQVDADEARTHP